ncbi:MAG: hypothetical protein DCO97_19570, partial [Marivita sp. XM-24bin2]
FPADGLNAALPDVGDIVNADLVLKCLGLCSDTIVCLMMHVARFLRKRQVQVFVRLPQSLANSERLLQPARLRRLVFACVTPFETHTATPEWAPALLVDHSASTVAVGAEEPLTAATEVHVGPGRQDPFTLEVDHVRQRARLLREFPDVYLRGMVTNHLATCSF